MRFAPAVCLAACVGCGDNAPVCGHVQVLEANRNIWPGHVAVDAERIYFSDYANSAGTHLVFRQPRDGGQPLVIAARGETQRFGFGMTTDDRYLYWSAEAEPAGYNLLATPLLGGRTLDLGAISECTANGIAVDAVAAYAGAIRCDMQPARVIAVPHDGSGLREIWSSPDADVTDIVPVAGDVVIATTAGLVRVSATGTTLLDGHPTYHVVVDRDELVYSTEEAIYSLPIAGGAPRRLYTYRTPITEIRAFGVDNGDLYIAEPPGMIFQSSGGEPSRLVHDIGATVTHIVARDRVAYWSTIAVTGSLGLIGSYSGAVMRVDRPCD
jgi:hypothetical protein